MLTAADPLARANPNEPPSAAALYPPGSETPLMAITPPIASEPHSADWGPRTISMREARSALSSSKRGSSPAAGSLILIPSTNSKVWFASAPRMRTSVSEPAGPPAVRTAGSSEVSDGRRPAASASKRSTSAAS